MSRLAFLMCIGSLLLVMSGCQSLGTIDRSEVSRPTMSLVRGASVSAEAPLTNLRKNKTAGVSACSVCSQH